MKSRASIIHLRAYEATSAARKLGDWDRVGYGPNSALDDADVGRVRTQEAIRNNPWLRRALRLLVSHLIGCGIQPRPKIDDAEQRASVLALWNDWASEADADGVLDFYGLQSLMARARLESGEVFVRFRPRRPDDGLAVPLQVQLLEADLLPIHHNSANGTNPIRQGIERDAIGRRVAYWFYREHPSDRYITATAANLRRVPAAEILHHYLPDRPGQLRGASDLLCTLLRARNLDQYESAELTRKKNRAKFNGAIYRENPEENPLTDNPADVDAEGRAVVDIEEGYMLQLGLNERIELPGGDPGGQNMIDFLRTQLRGIAAGCGVPYELMTGDYADTNDRVMRVILNAFYRELEALQDHFIAQVLQPIWRAWLTAAVYSGALDLPGYATNPRVWQRCEWRGHAWSYVNPLQEAETAVLRIQNGLTSRAAVVAESGWDVEDVDKQQAADHEREEALGLRYGAAGDQPEDADDVRPAEVPT
ncbi:MAG: phage portal protein [Chromatiaceae bacterium]|nr:phage portal protein [Candidatus Thioaporhodococcus sediminis]